MRLKGGRPSQETIAMKVTSAMLLTLLMIGGSLSGCFGDFLDMAVDQHGRPWFGLSHNLADIGIFATLTEGPALRGLDAELGVMPLGGEETL